MPPGPSTCWKQEGLNKSCSITRRFFGGERCRSWKLSCTTQIPLQDWRIYPSNFWDYSWLTLSSCQRFPGIACGGRELLCSIFCPLARSSYNHRLACVGLSNQYSLPSSGRVLARLVPLRTVRERPAPGLSPWFVDAHLSSPCVSSHQLLSTCVCVCIQIWHQLYWTRGLLSSSVSSF